MAVRHSVVRNSRRWPQPLKSDGDAQAAISAVNAAEHNPTACGMATAAFVRGPQLATARNKDTTFNIVRLFVVAVVTEAGVESVTPAAFFSLIPIEEIPV